MKNSRSGRARPCSLPGLLEEHRKIGLGFQALLDAIPLTRASIRILLLRCALGQLSKPPSEPETLNPTSPTNPKPQNPNTLKKAKPKP